MFPQYIQKSINYFFQKIALEKDNEKAYNHSSFDVNYPIILNR